MHSSGLVYVADSSNNRIAVFSEEGKLVRTFGSQGGGRGEFKNPTGVAVSPDGHHLYVSDRDNHRIQVFTLEGQYVREFGTDQLKGPTGLTVTSDGSVLVTDKEENRVAVFDKKGELIHSIAVEGPRGLTFDTRGDLLVASYRNHCVYYLSLPTVFICASLIKFAYSYFLPSVCILNQLLWFSFCFFSCLVVSFRNHCVYHL